MADKRPAFLFYPGDWLKDTALRSVSVEARGVWIDMLCLMHESARRGYLQHATGKPVTPEQLARMTGCSAEQVSRLLQELIDSGVCSCTAHGAIYNRRMVRDEQKRSKCSEAGKKGVTLKGQRQGQYKGPPQGVPETENESETLSVSVSVVSEEKQKLELLVQSLRARHPAIRTCGPAEIRKQLSAIVRKLTELRKEYPAVANALELLELIDRNHELYCKTAKWQEQGGQFARGLANWLAPTEKRYMDPPTDEEVSAIRPPPGGTSKMHETVAALEFRKQIGWQT